MFSARTIRTVAYVVEILLCFVLQGASNIIPEVFSSKPILLICCAVTISFFEDDEYSVIVAMICGLLVDIGAGTPAGAAAIALVILCFSFSKIFTVYFRVNFLSALLCGAIAVFITVGMLYVSGIVLPNYLVVDGFFIKSYLPTIIYTCALLPVFYFINKAISGNMKKKIEIKGRCYHGQK